MPALNALTLHSQSPHHDVARAGGRWFLLAWCHARSAGRGTTMGGCGLFLTRSVFRGMGKGVYSFLNAMNIYSRNVTFDSVGSAFYLYKSYLSLQNTTVTNATEAIGLFGFTGWATVWGDHDNVWNVQYLAGPNMATPPLYANVFDELAATLAQ